MLNNIKLFFLKVNISLVVILAIFIFTSSAQASNFKEVQQDPSKRILLKEQMGLLGPVKIVKLYLMNKDTDYVKFTFREDGSLALIDNSPDVSPSQSIQTFDSKERPLKEQIIDSTGSKLDVYSNYDEDRQSFTTKTASGVVLRVGKMDKKGHIIEVNNYDVNGLYVGKTIYEYNREGLVIRTNNYTYTNILMSRREFSYDSNGYNIERTFYKPTTMPPTELQLDTKDTKRYDSQGRVLESETYFERDHAVKKTSYTYPDLDNYGNWTRSQESVTLPSGKERINIHMRQFEYFE